MSTKTFIENMAMIHNLLENPIIEELLQLLIAVVDTELLVAVHLIIL